MAVELALPLAIDGHLCDFYDVADVKSQRGFVVGIGNPGLLHSGKGWQFPLKIQNQTFNHMQKLEWNFP